MRRNLSEELTQDRDIDVSREVSDFDKYKGLEKPTEAQAKEMGRAIKKARTEAGWTRAELARRIGIQDRTIGRWEHEGTDYDNLVIAFQALRGLRLNMTGVGKPVDLTRTSTLDLATELLARAKVMEERDRQYRLLRDALERDGLASYLPRGF